MAPVEFCACRGDRGAAAGVFHLADTSLSTNLSDLASPGPSPAWRNAPGPIGLVGHSLGGAACLLATGEWQRCVRRS